MLDKDYLALSLKLKCIRVSIFRVLVRLFICLINTHFVSDELVHEKEKYKYICDDLDLTFTELIEKN